MTCIRDLMSLVDEIAPWNTAVDWDNSGLMVGQSSARVETVALALDPSPKHIQAAHARQAQVLLTHHPLIFKPLKKIDFEDNIGLAIQKAIRLGVGIISAHTNLDQARQGVARALAEKIGLEWQAPLEPTVVEKRYKVIFQAPERLAMEIEKTLSNWSAESVEPVSVNRLFDMRDGGASSNGTPTMVRIEAMADDRTLRPMLRAVESIPEVAAIKPEIYGLTDDLARKGFGCIGKFTQPVLFTRLVAELKEKLKANSLRYLHAGPERINTVALLPGSGGGFVRLAKRKAADVLITGDVGYHDVRDAEQLGMSVIDAGHWATEIPVLEKLADELRDKTRERGLDFKFIVLDGDRDPWSIMED